MLRHTIDLRAVLKTAGMEGHEWLHGAREACGAALGATTSFDGEFVDSVGAKALAEGCDIVHATLPLFPLPAQFLKEHDDGQRIVEFGAVAIVLAAFCKRSGLRMRECSKNRGDFYDYVLEDASGRKAGVLEIKGRSDLHTTRGVREATEQVLKSTAKQCRIGAVAFRGMKMRLERVR